MSHPEVVLGVGLVDERPDPVAVLVTLRNLLVVELRAVDEHVHVLLAREVVVVGNLFFVVGLDQRPHERVLL